MQISCKLLLIVGLGALAMPAFAGCGPSPTQLRSARPMTATAVGRTNANAAVDDLEFSATDPAHSSIVGLWDIKFVAGGEVVDEGFDAWHSDQTEVLNDNPPPATGNVCLGAWAQIGRNTFKLKHPSWVYDQATNTQVIGQAIIRETVTVSPDGNSFSGSYSLDIVDTTGNLLEHFEGQVKATRIRPD